MLRSRYLNIGLFGALWTMSSAFPLTISTVSSSAPSSDNDTLVLVQVIWRHGDRTPAQIIKTDEFNQLDSWPRGLNQLTVRGIEQQFQLGQKLKRRYIDELQLVNRSYSSYEVYVRSSNIDRTLLSATANMVGFYGGDDNGSSAGASGTTGQGSPTIPGWPKHYVPVPIHTVDLKTDHLPNLDEPCPRRDTLTELLKESPQFAEMVRKNQPFFDQLSAWCGEEVDAFNLWAFLDTLYINRFYNRTMPTWATDEVVGEIEAVNSVINAYLLGVGVEPYRGVNLSVELRRTRAGSITWAMLENARDKAKCIEEGEKSNENSTARKKKSKLCKQMDRLKYYAFSMHDMTLNALAAGLGVETKAFNCYTSPPYATAVSMELRRRDDGKFFVKLLLLLPSSDKFVDITADIPKCPSGECELNGLLERSELIRPKPSMDELCENFDIFSGSHRITSPPLIIIFTIVLLHLKGIWLQ